MNLSSVFSKTILLGWLVVLLNCGPTVKVTPTTFPHYQQPTGVSAILKITLFQNKQKKNVTCIASVQPNARIKLEFMGLLGKQVADFYWVKDSLWGLYIPSEKVLYQGPADSVSLPVFEIKELMLGPFLDYLWDGLREGGGWENVSETKKQRKLLDNESNIRYWVSPSTGLVHRAERAPYEIRYKGLLKQMPRAIPERVDIYSEGKVQMKVKVEKVKDNPAWKKSPFFLKVPEDIIPTNTFMAPIQEGSLPALDDF